MPRMTVRHRYFVRRALDASGWGLQIEREEPDGSWILLDESEPNEHPTAESALEHGTRYALEQRACELVWDTNDGSTYTASSG